MKRPTRILAIVGTLILLLLALLVVLPLLFRDRIAQRAKVEVNRSLDARVEWRDVGLTFFRNFPNLTLRLDDLTVAGKGKFEGDTLAAIRHFQVVLDLASVLRSAVGSGGGPIVVRAVELDQPRLSLIALEDGTANWDITKKTPETAPSGPAKPVAISLRHFEIRDAAIAYDDRKAKLKATLAGYDQSLTGDFSQDLVGIQTKADADTVSLTFTGIPYLNRVRLGLTADVRADLAHKSYTLKDTELRLNDLRLGVSGSARSVGKQLGLDLKFAAPSTKFRDILSLVPAIYAHDFEKVKTAGTIAVSGQVKGEYGDSVFPSFALKAKVDNAAFQYPDLPLPARDIFLDLAIANPGGSADNTVVKLSRFHLLLGRNPVDASMVLRTPVSDPDVDLRGEGQGGSGRRPPQHEARGHRPADRYRRGRRRGAHADVVHRQETVRAGRGERHRGRGRPHRQGQGPAASALDPAGVAPAGPGARGAPLLRRLDRQQRRPGDGIAGEPARLHVPGRRPARDRDRPEQPVQPERVAVRRGRPAGHPGAAEDRFRARRHRGRADVRQPQDDQRAWPPPREGPARHAGRLPDEHAGRRDRA